MLSYKMGEGEDILYIHIGLLDPNLEAYVKNPVRFPHSFALNCKYAITPAPNLGRNNIPNYSN